MPPRRTNRYRAARCLVTGATSGIGRALCRELLRRGALVVAAGRRIERLRSFTSATSFISQFDLDNLASIRRLFQETEAAVSGLDYCFHAAGTCFYKPFLSATDVEIERVIRRDLVASVVVAREAVRLLRRSAGARTLVVIGSLAGASNDHPMFSAYAAAKEGLAGLLRSMRAEFRADALRVVLACPAGVETGIAAHSVGGRALRRHMRTCRLDSPEVVANGILDGIDGPLVDGELRLLPTARARAAFRQSRPRA